MIERFNSIAPNGYNVNSGGMGFYDLSHSEESKRKMSEKQKGKKLKPESVAGRTETRKGYRHSEEAKSKIRKAAELDRAKSVAQINLKTKEVIAIFSSTRAAQRKTGISQSSISKVANNKTGIKKAGNYFWKYV